MINFVCDYALTSPSILVNKVEKLIPNSTAYFTDIDEDRFILRALVNEMDKENLFSLVQPFLYRA